MMGPRSLLPIDLLVLLVVVCVLLSAPPAVALFVTAFAGGALAATWALWRAVPAMLRPMVRAELVRRLGR